MANKNPGPVLTSEQLGEHTQIPPEFIAAMNLTVTSVKVSPDVAPDALSDTVIYSVCEQVQINERKKTTYKKKPGPIVLRDIRNDQDGQPVQVVRTLFQTGTQTPTQPTATVRAATQDLGNGWSIEEVSTEGVYDDNGNFVPSVFSGVRYEVSIPDVVPEEFRVAVPTTRTDTTVSGLATTPILQLGDLKRVEEQIDEFKKRTTVVTRSGVTLPVSLAEKETNQVKQVVSKTRTYRLAGSDTLPSATQDVEVQNLGDGRVIETVRAVPSVFAANRFIESIPDVVPERFRVAIPVKTTESTSAGIASDPILQSGDLEREDTQLDAFNHRLRITGRADVSLPQSLVGKDTNESTQIVTVTETYKLAGSDAVPSALQDVSVQNLGDGRVIQTVRAVPSVFAANRYITSIPDVVPERFRVAIPVETSEITSAGTVSQPDLQPGDLEREDIQLTAFKRRLRITGRADVTLPAVLVSKDTDQDKVVVTVTETYRNAGVDAVPNATQDVAVQNLGDGRVIETVRSIPAVFKSADYTTEILDTIPPEFQSFVPRKTTITTAPGADPGQPPVLGAGELRRRVYQPKAFLLRTEVTSRDTVTTQTLSDTFFGGPSDGEGARFTGLATRTRTYNPSAIPTADQSLLQFESRVQAVTSSSGVKATSSLAAYPDLWETLFNPRSRITTTRHKTIVAATDVNPTSDSLNFYEQKVLDSQRKVQVHTIVADVSGSTDVYQKYPGIVDIELPPVLLSVTGIANTNTSESDYGTGAFNLYTMDGKGSGNVSLRGRCGAAAGVITDISYDVRVPWTRNIPCVHWVIPMLRTNANVRLGTIVGALTIWNFRFGPTGTCEVNPSLNAWPVFVPREVQITCKSQSARIEAEGEAARSSSIVVDYLGTLKQSGQGQVSGGGGTVAIENGTKIITIPPTIHQALTVSQPTGLQPTATGSGIVNCGGVTVAISAFINTGGVVGSITPGSITATPNQNSIPTSGLYLWRLFIEPYEYDYLLLHYVTVDFANIII